VIETWIEDDTRRVVSIQELKEVRDLVTYSLANDVEDNYHDSSRI
jgi:hypothetical protein